MSIANSQVTHKCPQRMQEDWRLTAIRRVMRSADSAIDKCLAVRLALDADEMGEVSVPLADIMQSACVIDQRTAAAAIQRLESSGLLAVVRTPGRANTYRLMTEERA